jgi:hypothetical protein
MKRYDQVNPIFQEGRKQPIASLCARLYEPWLAIPGHYETACGGCDTIHSYDEIFNMVRHYDELGRDVLFEGLLISGDLPRTLALHTEGRELMVIGLTEVSLDVCEASIRGRREAKAASKGVPPREFGPNLRRNLEAKFKLALKTCDQLEAAGVTVVRADRATALETVIKALRLNR